jgi:hypothetical protein
MEPIKCQVYTQKFKTIAEIKVCKQEELLQMAIKTWTEYEYSLDVYTNIFVANVEVL